MDYMAPAWRAPPSEWLTGRLLMTYKGRVPNIGMAVEVVGFGGEV